MRALLALSGGCRRRFRASGALRALYSKFVWRGRKGQNARLEHFSAACPVSLLRVRYSGSLRGRLHRCTRETCSARIDLRRVFAVAPLAFSLTNGLNGCRLTICPLTYCGKRRLIFHSMPLLPHAPAI